MVNYFALASLSTPLSRQKPSCPRRLTRPLSPQVRHGGGFWGGGGEGEAKVSGSESLFFPCEVHWSAVHSPKSVEREKMTTIFAPVCGDAVNRPCHALVANPPERVVWLK